jgi:hypothetical protein
MQLALRRHTQNSSRNLTAGAARRGAALRSESKTPVHTVVLNVHPPRSSSPAPPPALETEGVYEVSAAGRAQAKRW